MDTDPIDAGQILAAVEAKRGYLLPYHRMLGTHDPGLLAAYDAYYQKLTLDPRALTAGDRELVWTALQAATREAHGQIHLRRADAAGVPRARLAEALAVAAAVEAWPVLAFGRTHWGDWFAAAAVEARYLALFEGARGDLPAAIAELIAVTCHAARRSHDGMRLHLPRAFAAGASTAALAEALSYLLLPAGGPCLIDATAAWKQAAEDGLCPAPW
ncbi:MAG: hypothetical protein OHK0024_29200 [Thalassobaculales bacterium]